MYYDKYIKYKNKYLQLKNQLGGKEFCDKAYKNILGTCWAVAIQTMFTFSDTTSEDLKRIMESIYLNSENLSFDELKKRKEKFIDDRIQVVQTNILLNSFYRWLNKYFPDYFYKGKKREYLKKILDKFIDRYYSKVLEFNNTQKPEEIDDKKNLERCELVIVQNFKRLFEDSILKYIKEEKYGGNIITEYLFFNLLSVFFLGYKVSLKTYYDNFKSINFDSEKDIGIIIHIEGHACCLYICNGQQKYYNDWDKKVYNCDWITLLKTSENLYVELGEILREINYNSYERKHNLRKVLELIVVSKHTMDSDLDIEIKKILNFTDFNPSDFKDREIQNILGHIYSNNDLGVAQNLVSIQWFRLAAAQGNINAMINLGLILSEGVGGIAQDKQEAMQFYHLASEKGYGEASLKLGDMIDNDDSYDDIKKKEEVVRLYRLAAEQTNTTAQFKLANILLNDKKIEEAMKWLIIAAEKKNIDAQVKLGDIYYKGEFFAKDNGKALYWYNLAADNGHVEAQFKLGKIYDSLARNQEALYWYNLAADHGHAGAQFKLGEMYDSGKVVDIERHILDQRKDLFVNSYFIYGSAEKHKTEHKLKAVEWYNLAAKQGHVEAQKKNKCY